MSIDRVEALIPQFNLMVAGRFVEGRSYATWRTSGTRDWLLIHTEDGQGRFGLPDGSGDLLTHPGDAVLIAPGTRHDYGTGPAGRWTLQFSHFHPRTHWLPLCDWPQLAPGLGRIRLAGDVRRRATEALQRCVDLSHSGLERAEQFGLNALEEVLLWASTQQPGPGVLDPRLVNVLELIATRLAEPLDLDRLAAAAHLSGSRLAHLFKQQLGLAPRDFVEQRRMQAAEQLLELTTRSVGEVAAAVGFADPLYFSARFRRFSGLAPTDYRASRRAAP